MKEDYSELDAAILEAIKSGRNSFTVMSNALADKAKQHVEGKGPFGAGPAPGWRVIDRRLQALRKAGKIKYGRPGGWETA